MSKRFCFREAFDSQRVSGSKRLLWSEQQHFYPIVGWLWDRLSWKRSLLLGYQNSGLFLNTLSADYKYSRHNQENLQELIQIKLSKKLKKFYVFYCIFEINGQFLNNLKKKISLRAQVFVKLWTLKNTFT